MNNNFQTSDPSNKILAILHIPKTAGTSLASALSQAGVQYTHVLDPRFNSHITGNIFSPRDHLISFRDQIANGRCRIILGHMTRSDVLSAIGDLVSVDFATFIRNPVDRFISEYFYYTSNVHPDYEFMKTRYPSISSYAREAVDTNIISFYLERYRGQPTAELLDDMRREFIFIGQTERFDEDLPLFLSKITETKPPITRLNSGIKKYAANSNDVEIITYQNRNDMLLYSSLLQLIARESLSHEIV